MRGLAWAGLCLGALSIVAAVLLFWSRCQTWVAPDSPPERICRAGHPTAGAATLIVGCIVVLVSLVALGEFGSSQRSALTAFGSS